jgi:hypothetical protein
MSTHRIASHRRKTAVLLATFALLTLAVAPAFASIGAPSSPALVRGVLLHAESVGADDDELAELDSLDGSEEAEGPGDDATVEVGDDVEDADEVAPAPKGAAEDIEDTDDHSSDQATASDRSDDQDEADSDDDSGHDEADDDSGSDDHADAGDASSDDSSHDDDGGGEGDD